MLGGSDGALAQLRLAARRIERGAADHPRLADALAALDRALIEASEAEDKIARAADELTFDPARLEAAEARLFEIRGLARKHRVEPDALAELADRMRAQLSEIEAGGERIAELDRAGAGASALFRVGPPNPAGGEGGLKLDEAVAGELHPLKLDAARFPDGARPGRAGFRRHGQGRVRDFLQPRITVRTADQDRQRRRAVARFILALKVALAEAGSAGAMIFDEIDRGIGGAVASAIGERLARLAKQSQVLVVTHSPQVAARAATISGSRRPGVDGTRTRPAPRWR